MRHVFHMAVMLAALLYALPLLAFEPISYTAVKSLYGKTVYPSSVIQLTKGDRVWVLAGEPLTLVDCDTMKSTSTSRDGVKTEGLQYNFCQVQTVDGKKGTLQLRHLSQKPLLYNLREPGKARELLVKVFEEAYPLAERMHKVRAVSDYTLSYDTGKVVIEGADFIGDDYHVAESMREAFEFGQKLVHNLVYGSRLTKDSIMRDEGKKWIVSAEDGAILDWFATGIPDKALQKQYVDAKQALDKLDNVSSAGFDMANTQRQVTEKPWRRGIKDVPEAKLEALDKENIDKLEKRKADLTKRIEAAFAEARKLKARIK